MFGTISSQFNDPGVTAAYHELLRGRSARKRGVDWKSSLALPASRASKARSRMIPANRQQYLAEIAATCAGYRKNGRGAGRRSRRAPRALRGDAREPARREGVGRGAIAAVERARERSAARASIPQAAACSPTWPATVAAYRADELRLPRPRPRGATARSRRRRSSGLKLPKVALPRTQEPGRDPPLPDDSRTCRAGSRTPPACSSSGGSARTRRGSSPARDRPSGRTGASTTSRGTRPRSGSRRRSTR